MFEATQVTVITVIDNFEAVDTSQDQGNQQFALSPMVVIKSIICDAALPYNICGINKCSLLRISAVPS